MEKRPLMTWGLGILGVAALGAAAYFLTRQAKDGNVMQKLEGVAEDAKGKAGGIARTLREKATPLMQTIGDLVEKNAEVVSAVANINAEQVRKTGQEIKQAAQVLDSNLKTFSNM